MRRFSTILLYVTIAFLLLWQLPWCYNFFVVKPEKTPFTLYSFVIGDFAQMGQEEGKGSVRRDLAGNIYSEAAFDSILPMFYFRRYHSRNRSDSQNGADGKLQLPQRSFGYQCAFYRTLPANGIHVRTCGFKNAG